jgi:hypothetical protein
MTTLKHQTGITEHLLAFTRLAGSLAYTIFKMAAWTVGLAALGFAVLFYMGGLTELIGGAIRVAAASAVAYLAVTQIVKKVFLSVPASPEEGSNGPHVE